VNAYRIPFLPGHRMAVVEVRFGKDIAADLLVDTGAERTVVVPRLAHRLDLNLETPVGRIDLHGVGGRQRAPICRVDRLAIGAIIVPQHEVLVADVPTILNVRGLLGLDVLRRFRGTFEFDSRTLVLREPA
jgi:predicted aspartyl protease